VVAGVAVGALLFGACGGDDDDADSTATTLAATVAPTTVVRTTVAPTTVAPTTTTTIVYVTEGATVVVANASGINGAAGRLTDRLAVAGFSTGEATNSGEAVGKLATSQVYYDPEADGAQAVAESLRSALGGGEIELLELGVPAPTESGEIGDATVLVLMGDDIADKSLEELQGRAPAATTDDATDDTTTTTDDATDGSDDTTETTDATEG
jgi:hypothetical protein